MLLLLQLLLLLRRLLLLLQQPRMREVSSYSSELTRPNFIAS